MKLRNVVSVATLALFIAAWSDTSRCENYSEQDQLTSSSSASQFYATARFTDRSGNNHHDFAQPIGQEPGTNTPSDGYIIDPNNNMVNLQFSIDNGQSSFGYNSGNVQIVWSTIPAGYPSASAFKNSVKVSGTKGSGQINNNGLYVWTSKKAVKPGHTATVTFQFPLYASDGTIIRTLGPASVAQLFSQKWGFTVKIKNQPDITVSAVYLSGTINLERTVVTLQTSGCIQPNQHPVGGPVSFSYLIFPTFANTKNVSDAFKNHDSTNQNPQEPLCPDEYTTGIINANYTYSAYYECRSCECPDCGEACTIEPPVTCWPAIAVYKNAQCRFQTYSNTLETSFTFSGLPTTKYETTDAYCCPSLP